MSPYLKILDGFFPEEKAATEEAMVRDLGQADKAEPHAESQQSPAGRNVADPRHLLRLPEPLRVRFLDKDVDDGQVLAGVVVDLVLDGPGQGLVVQLLGAPSVGRADAVGRDVGHQGDG